MGFDGPGNSILASERTIVLRASVLESSPTTTDEGFTEALGYPVCRRCLLILLQVVLL